jgi:hypothetical protein
MSSCEYQAKAKAAMQMAAAATCEKDRSDWLRVALTWQDLSRVHSDCDLLRLGDLAPHPLSAYARDK